MANKLIEKLKKLPIEEQVKSIAEKSIKEVVIFFKDVETKELEEYMNYVMINSIGLMINQSLNNYEEKTDDKKMNELLNSAKNQLKK